MKWFKKPEKVHDLYRNCVPLVRVTPAFHLDIGAYMGVNVHCWLKKEVGTTFYEAYVWLMSPDGFKDMALFYVTDEDEAYIAVKSYVRKTVLERGGLDVTV